MIKNIDVVKSGRCLFKNFSWEIQNNENWVITGVNGSGKTILLEALSGVLHFPNGEICYDFIAGDTWEERYNEKRKQINYIPAHALDNFIKGGQELYYQQRYYDLGDEDIATVRAMLGENVNKMDKLNMPASLSIAHLLDVEVTKLSNGQLKKLLLLRNFLKGIPKLLLLDYPFEGLDFESRENLCEFIDFMSSHHHVQVILVDHHHHLPACINRRLFLNNFEIEKVDRSYISGIHGHDAMISLTSKVHGNDAEEVVRMQNVQLKYGDKIIFENFNWKVSKGERWALVGRNGAGKTTLFSMIFADHPQAYAQRIFLFGKRRGSGESIWDIKKRINYLGPEQISYLNHKGMSISGKDYFRDVHSKLDEEVLNGLIVYFHAEEFIKKPMRFLSSGELQLLMIMNCFLVEKELLLLDEPFQFLDDFQKERLTRYLLTHLKGDTTLILITHYAHDIRQWTDLRMEM
ncbi:ATP-binding cassette domain-containing protein [Chryseolinea sp. H1M3-3]|uniref:ATP-binding cassette domain-containing protein n=1 Tax=Chryseolinea sp. H1M3-3 TaxID=3034144 RepID=UPI0023ED1A9A|nr:ATP-binding cassette domain-containing protein [Chryseolinea sp. H1M3-3]